MADSFRPAQYTTWRMADEPEILVDCYRSCPAVWAHRLCCFTDAVCSLPFTGPLSAIYVWACVTMIITLTWLFVLAYPSAVPVALTRSLTTPPMMYDLVVCGCISIWF